MAGGIIITFIGMLMQALTYCLVKETARRTGFGNLKILVLAHSLMGLVCLIPFAALGLYEKATCEVLTYALLVDGTYLAGQFFIFRAVNLSDPSAAGPYLILKLPLVALFSILVFDGSLSVLQTAAVCAIVMLSLLYSNAVHIKAVILLLVLASASCFALCDIFVMKAMRAIIAASPLLQAVYCVIISDVCFLLLLPLLLSVRARPGDFVQVVPLSASWILGVVFTIAGFNLTSVISGNIVLSLRSAAVVVLTALFFKAQISGPWRIKTKLAAAVGLCLCVVLYYLPLA